MARKHKALGIDQMRVFQLEPNLTAILPGKCQARCPFCLEPEGPRPRSIAYWLRSFEVLLAEMPPIFQTVSVSGGEPSISPAFGEVLSILSKYRDARRLRRTVLTTNGSLNSLTKHMQRMGDALTHVNVSRHAVDDVANSAVFKTEHVPTSSELSELILGFRGQGLPVNLNCVYSSRGDAFGMPMSRLDLRSLRIEAERFIAFAQGVGASSITFRHDHREPHLDQPTLLELSFGELETVHEALCESCHVTTKIVGGMPVNFKRSAFEPVDLHYEIELYEMVLHSNGGLYRDWSRRHPIKRPLPNSFPSEDWRRNSENRVKGGGGATECDSPIATCQLLSVRSPL